FREDVVDERTHCRLRAREVLELSAGPPNAEQLQVQVGKITVYSNRCLVPGGDVRHRSAEEAIESAQDIEVEWRERFTLSGSEGSQILHASMGCNQDFERPARSRRHESSPMLIGADHALAQAAFVGEYIGEETSSPGLRRVAPSGREH